MGLFDRLFRTDSKDRELDAELRFHIDEQVRERVAAGMDPIEARRRVMIEFGALEATKEECRDVRGALLAGIAQDLAYAMRTLRRSRVFTLAAVLTLGTAIGVDTSFFVFYNAMVLQPWPVKEPDRVIRVSGRSWSAIALGEWAHLAKHTRSLQVIGAAKDAGSTRWNERRLSVVHLSASYLHALGLPLERGRWFTAAEDEPGRAAPIAILSYRLWASAFGSDPAIIGRHIDLDGVPFTVVGIAPRRFSGARMVMDQDDVFLPLGAMRAFDPNAPADYRDMAKPVWATLIARLADGVSVEQAKAELSALRRQFQAQHGLPLEDPTVRGTAEASTYSAGKLLQGFAYILPPMLLVLLLACANVGNLLLARGHARRREMAVRLSLGATRLRLLRQLLTESLLIALAAGALGLAIACILPELVMGWVMPADRPAPTFRLDHRVFLFAAGLSTLASVAFGLTPALQCTRLSIAGVLKDALGIPGRSLSLGLLRMQVALSVILLAAAGLMLRGLQHAHAKDLGFRQDGLSLLHFETPRAWTDAERRAFARQVRDEIERLGSAQTIALASRAPLDRSWTRLNVPGRNTPMLTWFHEVSKSYFDLLGTPIVAGAGFAGDARHDEVMVVNETLARRLWPGETAIGKIATADGVTRRVIGVVRDAHLAEIGSLEPMMFWPMAPDQLARRVLIRDGGRGLAAMLSAFTARVAPEVRTVTRPFAEALRWRLAQSSLAARVAAGVGLWGLTLAALGLSGMFAYVVQQRTREIGIRVALGARTADVLRAVLGPTARALFVGLVLGIAGALAVSRLLRSVLYGLSALDPLTYAGVALLLAAAGLAAAYVPARRAMSVDPTVALKYE